MTVLSINLHSHVYSGLVCFVLCYIMIEFTYTERYVVVICTAGTVTCTVYRIVLLCKALNTDGIYIHVNTRVQGNIHIRLALPIVYT